MQLTAQPLDLRLARPFRIARSVQREAHDVLARLEHDGITGLGEGAPGGYYGETRDGALAALRLFADILGSDPFAIADIMDGADRRLHGNPAAKAALDSALYDWVGQRLGVPIYRLLGLSADRVAYTSYTVSIDSSDEMARQAAALREYPILKVKLGTADDVATIRAIREASDATIRVDANAAWTAKQAIATINAIAPFGIEFVEQPVARDDLAGLKLVRENVPVPIIADESCVTLSDIPRLVGRVDGISIKLMKCGGLHHALKMIHAARAHHLKVMIGCMIESSVAITAAAHLTPLADYADLDGALLLAIDPYEGATFPGGRIVLPERPGLGIRPRAEQARPAQDKAQRARRGATPASTGALRIDEEC